MTKKTIHKDQLTTPLNSAVIAIRLYQDLAKIAKADKSIYAKNNIKDQFKMLSLNVKLRKKKNEWRIPLATQLNNQKHKSIDQIGADAAQASEFAVSFITKAIGEDELAKRLALTGGLAVMLAPPRDKLREAGATQTANVAKKASAIYYNTGKQLARKTASPDLKQG